MKKGLNKGIIFDNTVFLSEEHNRRFPIYMRLLQVAVIFLGCYCIMDTIIDCFEIQIISTYLIAAIIISVFLFYAMLLYPKKDAIKIILLIFIYGGVVFYRYDILKNGFYLLENAIIKRASRYYGFDEFSFYVENSNIDRDLTFVLIMLVIPVIWILTFVLLRGRLKMLCYIIIIASVAVCFAMGAVPSEANFIIIILTFLFILITNGYPFKKTSLFNTIGSIQKGLIYRISIRSAFTFCILALLLFLIIKQFVPEKKYESFEGVLEAQTSIENFMMDFNINDITDKLENTRLSIRPNRWKGSGGLSLGKLGRLDQVIHDDTEHLVINAPIQSVMEGIYLKGYIGSVYTGDSWETHSKQIRRSYNNMMTNISQDKYNPTNTSAEILSHKYFSTWVNRGSIELRYLQANRNYVYAPYFTLFKEDDGVSFEYDLATVADRNKKIRSYNYIYNVSERIYHAYDEEERMDASDYSKIEMLLNSYEDERTYRSFVYETYTKLPKEGLDRLKHDFSREVIGTKSENLLEAINYIMDYLNRSTSYTLSPGRLPRNKDFVEYFLYENKIGYCTHFASAGALMLRAMGYPSRYVEGYLITEADLMNQTETSYRSDENSTVEIIVKDYNAHAWVEVYYDGFGWIPVEFTTGYDMDILVEELGAIEKQYKDATKKDAIVPTEVTPSPTERPEDNEIPSIPISNQEEGTDADNFNIEDKEKVRLGLREHIMIVLLFIFTSGFVFYLLYRWKQRKIITDENYSQKALRIYRRIERLVIHIHILPKKAKSLEDGEEYAKKHLTMIPIVDFMRCMDTVRKARFGKGSISYEEYMTVEYFYTNFWNRIYEGLPFIKKVYFRLCMNPSNY